MLKRFAQMLKWPNLGATLEALKQRDQAFTLDTISSDAFAFFSGLVLPGVSHQLLTESRLQDSLEEETD